MSLNRHPSDAYKSTEFDKDERVQMVFDDLFAHLIDRFEAAKRIRLILDPKYTADASGDPEPGEYIHWVSCENDGKVHVYHVSDCEGGQDCALFQYLEKCIDDIEIKRGSEYVVTMDATGKFKFKRTGTIKRQASEECQSTLL